MQLTPHIVLWLFGRSVLAGYLPSSIQPRDLLFERNAHGKPCLLWPFAMSGEHKLHFNLTHTASLIGLAVTGAGFPHCAAVLCIATLLHCLVSCIVIKLQQFFMLTGRYSNACSGGSRGAGC